MPNDDEQQDQPVAQPADQPADQPAPAADPPADHALLKKKKSNAALPVYSIE